MLFEHIKASPTCTALLGSDLTRFFEFGTAPTLETVPYATWQILTGSPYNDLEGAAADHITSQIDIWGATPTEVRTVQAAIRQALNAHGYFTFIQTERDHESGLYRGTLHFQSITT